MAKPEKILKMSVDEYLRLEENSSVKHEYVDGEVFEMTGGTLAECECNARIHQKCTTRS